MEIIRGKQTSIIDTCTLNTLMRQYQGISLDIGTGDGRFVQKMATAYPERFVIGMDAARENLTKVSRNAPSNALFVIANAETMPLALRDLATHITINFPWGSLLKGLVTPHSSVLTGLQAIAQANAVVEIRLNAGALAETGWTLDQGSARVRELLTMHGFQVHAPRILTAHDLTTFPSTWTKRLAYGRDPRAAFLFGVFTTKV